MVKEAYSIELKRIITAEKARIMGRRGELKDYRNFICADKSCQIKLSATTWENDNPKRIYFQIGKKDHLHVAGCKQSGRDEENQRTILEKKAAKDTVEKNGLVILRKISTQTKTSQDPDYNKENNNLVGYQSKSLSSSITNNKLIEGSYLTSILSAIELFKDPLFDNDKKILKVDSNETLSLNQFFRDVGNNKNIPINRLGIYYGKVKVETFGDGNTGLKVIFCESKSIPKLYTNKKLMLEKFYGKHAKTHI
ncbi:hypothetical protein QMA04_17800, partial [Planococcus sp. APC 3900]|uniref:hypothetical protein n=1 Tax=Planococcus sp. APC 3900 TaxID=3035191 RepID=UPI0025B41579